MKKNNIKKKKKLNLITQSDTITSQHGVTMLCKVMLVL